MKSFLIESRSTHLIDVPTSYLVERPTSYLQTDPPVRWLPDASKSTHLIESNKSYFGLNPSLAPAYEEVNMAEAKASQDWSLSPPPPDYQHEAKLSAEITRHPEAKAEDGYMAVEELVQLATELGLPGGLSRQDVRSQLIDLGIEDISSFLAWYQSIPPSAPRPSDDKER